MNNNEIKAQYKSIDGVNIRFNEIFRKQNYMFTIER